MPPLPPFPGNGGQAPHTHQAAHWVFLPACCSTPLQQSPPPSDTHNKGDVMGGIWCLSLQEAPPHTSFTPLLSERQVTADGTGPARWIPTDHCSNGFLLTVALPVFLPVVITQEPRRRAEHNPLRVKGLHTQSAPPQTRIYAASPSPLLLLRQCTDDWLTPGSHKPVFAFSELTTVAQFLLQKRCSATTPTHTQPLLQPARLTT